MLEVLISTVVTLRNSSICCRHLDVFPVNSVTRLLESNVCRKHKVQQPQRAENGPKILGRCCRAAHLGTSANLMCCLANGDDQNVPDEKTDCTESCPPECVYMNNYQHMVSLDPATTGCPPIHRYRENVVWRFGTGHKIITEVHGDEVKTDNTGDCNVEVHDDKVALISESDADSSNVAVMVSFKYASAADDAVVAAWRLIVLTQLATPPGYRRIVDDCYFPEVI